MLFASEVRSFTCISCPLGCLLEVALNSRGEVEEISGFTCQLGEDYAREEAVAPRRMVCAALCVKGSLEPLSVKTAAAIPKESIQRVLDAIKELELAIPIDEGAVLVDDIAETGVALLATKSLVGD